MAQCVALLPHSKKVVGSSGATCRGLVPGPFCVEFACSPRVHPGSPHRTPQQKHAEETDCSSVLSLTKTGLVTWTWSPGAALMAAHCSWRSLGFEVCIPCGKIKDQCPVITYSMSSDYFKTARVKPLLKKPTLDTINLRNYRPVSLRSFLSKTLERAVSSQLSSSLSQNNLLDPHQSGFKATHSTETALLTVTESLRVARGSSLSSVLILLDLSAAVRHSEPPDPPLHSGRAWHCWICIVLVPFLLDRSHLSGHMEWLPVQTLHPWHRSLPRLSTLQL